VYELRGDDLFDSFALRYQVYCLDRGFLDPADYCDGLESDEFEWHARHVGVFDGDHRMLGAVRLVEAGGNGLPMDSHCTYAVPESVRFGEISRLAVPRSVGAAKFGTISLMLYRGLYQMARSDGLTHLLCAMEPSLERLARRQYIPWDPIGPLVDYYGWVRPYILDLDALDQQLQKFAPGTFELFRTPVDQKRGFLPAANSLLGQELAVQYAT
jgi:N-acyl-L-homoserine lactone synthetase